MAFLWQPFTLGGVGTSTATAAVTVGGAEFAGAATFVTPSYTATAALTTGGADFAGSATFNLIRIATAALSTGGAQFAGTATTTGPHPVGILSRSVMGLPVGPAGDFSGKPESPPFYEATTSLTTGGATLAASGFFFSPRPDVGPISRSVMGIPTAPAGNFSGKAIGTFSADAALTTGGAEFTGSATFTAPIYTATMAALAGGADFAGSATVVNPSFTATAAIVVGASVFAGSGTFTAPPRTATAAIVVGAAQFAGTASVPVFATAALTVGGAEFAGSAIFTTGTVNVATAALTTGGATFGAAATFVPEVDLLTDLLAYYRFNGNLRDSSGHDRHLFGSVPSPVYAAGLLNRCLSENGGIYPGSLGLSGPVASEPFTFSIWVYRNNNSLPAEPTGWESGAGVVFETQSDGSPTAAWALLLVGGGNLATGTMPTDQWNHLVATFDGTTLTVYLNGAVTHSYAPAMGAADWDDAGNFVVGADTGHDLDEVGFWGTDLTAQDVAALYNGGLGFDPTPPTVIVNRVVFVGTVVRRRELVGTVCRRRVFGDAYVLA